MRFEWRREWVPLVAMLAAIAATAALLDRLPDPMPIHWNVQGEPDGFAPKAAGAFVLPASAAGTYLLLFVLPTIDPRRSNIARFAETYRQVRSVMVLFLTGMQGMVLVTLVRGGERLDVRMLLAGMGLFMAVLGNVLPRVRSNWFLGVRTPWTLSNEVVWRDTHRLAGRVWVVCGLAALALSLAGASWWTPGLVAIILGAAAVPVVYSYLRYRGLQRGPGERREPSPPVSRET